MQQGYSGTPLIKKLGIKDSDLVKIINAPKAYFDWLGKDISSQVCDGNELPDIVHLFAKDNRSFKAALQKIIEKSLNRLPPFGYPGIKRARGSRQI
jgi:hypothetical protein